MKTVPKLTWILLVVAVIGTGALSPVDGAERTLGNNVVVGSFTLHVQIQEKRVMVMDRGGVQAATIPSTQLVTNFLIWDPDSRTASISVAIRNIGTASLFGPLSAISVMQAPPPPVVVPANPDSGVGPGSWRWVYGASFLGGSSILPPLAVSGDKRWDFTSQSTMDFQLDVSVIAGVPLPAGAGATIENADGTSITVQPNSIPYEALIDINSVPLSTITAPLGTLPLAGAVSVTFQPSILGGSTLPPSQPMQISFPAPTVLPSSQFILAQQLLIDFLGGSTPGLREQLAPVDTASFVAGKIVTNATIFPGVFGGGLYALIADTGSGFAKGTVTDATGPRPGVVVSNSTNTLVSATNGGGQYTLFISGGPFTVTAFNPFRGSLGATAGQIASSGSTVTGVDIFLTPLAAPPITRDGIRNSGFELGPPLGVCAPLGSPVPCWTTTGAAKVIPHLGPTSTGVIIFPTEGLWMADINTGEGSVGGVGSSLKQQFVVPAGVKTLRFNFNFVSEEFPEFVGTIFNDAFRAIIRKTDGTCAIAASSGDCVFAQVSVNQSGGFTLIGDCFFPGGDNTCGQTGWREGSVDLSTFAGTNTPIELELLFTANDAGDNIYDTHVLIDNIRFSTLWIDAKIIQGANRDVLRILQEVQVANEILSQAGLNVRIRNAQTANDPGGLLDTEIHWTVECRPPGSSNCKGVPTPEEVQLLGLARSATQTDANVYYVRSMTDNGVQGAVAGLAVGPDDYFDRDIFASAGAILQDVIGGCVPGGHILAHELGHLLISPQSAGDVLEHAAGATNFLGGSCQAPLLGLLNRNQSANMNRIGAPLLVP